jgi:hypothetical protein
MNTAPHIKAWLKGIRKDRAWLADQCGVSAPTVDGWLSAGRNIPEPSAKIIRQLMIKGPSLNPKLTLEQYNQASAKAAAKGQTLEDWISDLITASLKLVIFGGVVWWCLS